MLVFGSGIPSRLVRTGAAGASRRGAALTGRKVSAPPRFHSGSMDKTSHRPKPLLPLGAARVIEAAPSDRPLDDADAFVRRPDGWYWLASAGGQAFGPFASRGEARTDRELYNEEAPEEGESLREAELELGLADWIDAETGLPAEGQSTPHLEEH